MTIFNVFTLMGGIAMFLYGMDLMGKALEQTAGSKLQGILSTMTSSPIRALLLGVAVTAVIQSSGATTVMAVGFVNSGLMELHQAIGVIMGANIGTTVTGWLLSLSGLEGESFITKMLNPNAWSPILGFIGIWLYMIGKDRKRGVGKILLGFAILMAGMNTMSNAMSPLADEPWFMNLFLSFSNPVLGVIAGAVAKQYGFWIVKEYREAYNMFCCSGILFNHESERRGETFVTRKITLAAARIAQGKQDKLYLGNLSSLRDWGYAKDYVECMWLILQNKKPEDFVIATGEQHSVREFCQLAFHNVGIELEFVGEGMNEKGIDKATGKVVIEVSPDFYRPTDVVNLWGDPSKAKRELGWNPTKTTFAELVKIMVDHDMKKVAVERAEEHIQTNLAEYLEKGVIK